MTTRNTDTPTRGLLLSSLRDAAAICLLATVFFLIFLVVFTVNRQLFERQIIFYDAPLCLALTALVIFLVFLVVALVKRPPARSLLAHVPAALVVFVLAGYSFSITVPALIERSISLFIVARVSAAGAEGITANDLQSHFYDEYILRNDAVPKRLEEQIVSGNMVLKGDRYVASLYSRFSSR